MVTMSDGSRFHGEFKLPSILRSGFFNMSQITLSRDLTAADDGTGSWTIVATTADGQFSANLVITYTIAPPVPAEGPPVFSGWPTSVNLTDNMTAGTVVASGSLLDFRWHAVQWHRRCGLGAARLHGLKSRQ